MCSNESDGVFYIVAANSEESGEAANNTKSVEDDDQYRGNSNNFTEHFVQFAVLRMMCFV